jgi:multidrug resistance efflux pump
MLVVFILIPAWFYWLIFAQVAVYQNSSEAHFKLTNLGTEINVSESGLISYISEKLLTLGMEVEQGEILLELEHADINSTLNKIKVIQIELANQLALLTKEKDTLSAIHHHQLSNITKHINNLKERSNGIKAKIALQEEKVFLFQELHGQQQTSKLQLLDTQKELQKMQVELSSLESDLLNAESKIFLLPVLYQQELLKVKLRIAKLNVEIGNNNQQINNTNNQKIKHIIRSPVSGSVATSATFEQGQYLHIGDKLGQIISSKNTMIEAQFKPEEALGHLTVGQQATVRVKAFPWTQYGTIDAEIVSVASAINNRNIRVQLKFKNLSATTIPLSQDMPVNVEVITEFISPLNLLVKSAGIWVTKKTKLAN